MSAADAAGRIEALRQVAAVRRATERRDPRLLTRDEEVTLGRLLRHADEEVAHEALSLFCERNQALVRHIAARWFRRETARGVELDDLIQWGNEGLLRALAVENGWDPEAGKKFSTYATWWIEQRVRRGMDDHRTMIRLPVHMSESLRKLAHADAALALELGRRPTDEEAAARSGLSLKQIATARRSQRIANARSLESAATSPGDERELIEIIADGQVDVEDEVLGDLETAERRRLVTRLLGMVPKRHAEILCLRHGLDGHPPRTLEEIGEILGLTRERVRQLEAQAVEQIRAHGIARLRPDAPLAEPPAKQKRKYERKATATAAD